MFDVNATLVIFILSFLVFVQLLNALFMKPVGEVIEKRKQLIADELEQAKRAQETAGSKLSTSEQHLQKKREEAQKYIAEASAEAEKKKSAQISKLQEEGRKKMEAASQVLQAEKPTLVSQLVEQEQQLVKDIVGKLLGDSASVNISSEQVKRALGEGI
jgi:F0F1-type ATP synthase, subunit b